MITYLRIETSKTLPYPEAHTYIAHVREYPQAQRALAGRNLSAFARFLDWRKLKQKLS